MLLLRTMRGVGEVFGITIAGEVGDIARFGSPRKLIGCAGLAPLLLARIGASPRR